ncbi:PAS domain-containing protein [Ferrimonas senticii]|uniref:PAS domain-containing protein n=1 Tax=Ferrimonas senticii TaxID=394566 RepID=UPI0012EBA9DE|nr:PAS domain-containing protein [Ferrimonas senticii]
MANSNTIKQLLNQEDNKQRLADSRLLFIAKMVLVVVLVISFSEAMLQLNQQSVRERIANSRFAELQNYSDRLNDGLEALRLNSRLLEQLPLPTAAVDGGSISQAQAALARLQSNLIGYRHLALINANGEILANVGDQPLPVPPADLQRVLAQLSSREHYLSPLQLDQTQDSSHLWTLTPISHVAGGRHYLLAYIDISPMWRHLGDNATPLFMANQAGQLIDLRDQSDDNNHQLEQRFPGLWRTMVEQDFGQWHSSNRTMVFIKVRPNIPQGFYLFSYVDDSQMPMALRFRWQMRACIGLMLLFMILYLHQKRQQQLQLQRSNRGQNLAEALYQSGSGSMLFSAEGHCLGATEALCQELDIPLMQLKDRRFNRLFNSKPISIDMVWQLARGSGNWSGTLQLNGHTGGRLQVKLSLLPLDQLQSLMLLQLQESPQQRQQTLKLQQIELLCESASGLALLDNQQRIQSSNRALAIVCKTPMEQLIGRDWLELLPLCSSEMQQQLENQLNSRGLWQSQVWVRRGDAAIQRCLASIQLTESSHTEELQRVLTLTPIRDLSLVNDDDLASPLKRANLAQQLAQQPKPYVLMLLNISHSSTLGSFADADQLLFRQHLLLQQLAHELPPETILGQYSQPTEIQLLLPDWHHTKAATLAANLLKSMDDAGLGEQITIGLSQCDSDANWPQLLADAHAAIERARMTGQRYCLAYTRIPR